MIRITYFVHGTTTDNEKGIATGWNPGELSELGVRQSHDLKKRIKGAKFDAVFSSDLKRAVDSAGIIFGSNVILDKRLRESNYGDLNGAKEELVVYSEHIEEPFANGESLKDVENRVKGFLKELLEKHDGKSIAVLSHKSPQLAFEVIVNGKTWEQAIKEDWRLRKEWKPGWVYVLEGNIL